MMPRPELRESVRPRRVLMTADTIGGVWTYALELIRPLTEAGVQVALATMGEPVSAAQRQQAAAIPNLILHESGYKLEWMHEPWQDVDAAGEWLLAIARQFRPDVVHLNGYAHASLDWHAPVVVVAHSCVLSWWKAVKGYEAPAEWGEYQRRVAAGLHKAHAVVAPSHAMLRAVQEYYGPVRRPLVIYNCRWSHGFASDEKLPRVFSAGRLWDEAKNLRCLDRAAQYLRAPVFVAGETRRPEGGRAQANHARLLGQLSQRALQQWLAESAVFALPAKYEPFGLSALEAALSGCALVLGDIPSLREVWGDSAIYVDPESPEQLAAVLDALVENPTKCARFAQQARARARDFTPERTAAAYYQLYQQLIHEQPARTFHGMDIMRAPGRVPLSASVVVASRWSDLQEVRP